ncbi:MAG: dihydroneopterin aldolase [Gammaproteobacteria bacterium]|nr:dihydroneopterin aldolase [Gammaproteobacteria bacterium]
MNDDAVVIEGLKLPARVGIHAWERAMPRPLLLDLELLLDLRPAAASDALADTVDYAAVAGLAEALAGERHYALIESFAERLAAALFARFPLRRLRMQVAKPGAVAGARTVAVRIERSAADYPAASSAATNAAKSS